MHKPAIRRSARVVTTGFGPVAVVVVPLNASVPPPSESTPHIEKQRTGRKARIFSSIKIGKKLGNKLGDAGPKMRKGKGKSKGKGPQKDSGGNGPGTGGDSAPPSSTPVATVSSEAGAAVPAVHKPVPSKQNYVPSSQPGCLVAHHHADWIIGSRPFDFAEVRGVVVQLCMAFSLL